MTQGNTNLDELIRRYCDEVRSWTRSWLESNMIKPLPKWDENGNLITKKGDHFDIWEPKETMIEFSQEIAHEQIIPMIQEDMKRKGLEEEWEDLLLPSEDSAQDYIFPIFMKVFRDEAYQYLEKMHFVLREIDRDLLGFPKAGYAANRIFAAIVDEIEDELEEDRARRQAQERGVKIKRKTTAAKTKAAPKKVVSKKPVSKKVVSKKATVKKTGAKSKNTKKKSST